jgi:mono/diheme cytochrome c family protein
VLGALATSHKVGIAVVAGVFILFALACSFLLPAIWPSFPGKHVRLFVGVAVCLTAGMLATVIVLAGEPKEQRAAAGGEATTTTTGTATAPPTTPSTPSKPQAPPGNAAAGKALFNAQGCSACHTFKPAGATAKVGPDLDNLASDAAKANRGTPAQYAMESIKDPSAYVVPGYPNGVMPVFSSLSDKQVGDLVAFLLSGSKA